MTRDDIIRMARESGMSFAEVLGSQCIIDGWLADLERFAALVAAAEREVCAKVCESMRPSKQDFDKRFFMACTLNAKAIRARGNTHD